MALDAPPDLGPPWAAARYQVQRNGTRYYADPQPPCDLIADPHTEPAPGFSSLKPSKPFRKSVMVGETKYAVPLDWHRAGEWVEQFGARINPVTGVDNLHAFYKGVHVQRDRDFARGHAIHSAAEAALVGQGVLNVNPDAEPYIPHLTKWIADNVTDVHAVEAVVFGHGYGGTGDAWLSVRGTPCYVDWKSRGAELAHGIYEEEIGQGGAYTSARYCILPNADRTAAVRAPIPTAEFGLVLSIRPDGIEEFWYDLDGARESFNEMHAAYLCTSNAGKLARKAKVKPPAPPAPALTPAEQLARINTAPDEGGIADPAAVAALEAAYGALPPVAAQIIRELVRDAQRAAVPFHLKNNQTVRRFEIIRGLIILANGDLLADDETVRVILAGIIGDVARFPSINVGHLIGSMDATEAALFAVRCDRLVFGEVPASVDNDGTLTLMFT